MDARFALDLLQLLIPVGAVGAGYFWGRRNEREHLRELERREAASQDVMVFATRYPPVDVGPLDPVLVSACVVVGADAFKMLVAGLRKLVGGNFGAYERLLVRARREAVLRVKDQARAAGCQMVFNLRIETTPVVNGPQGMPAAEVLAYGTAFAPARGSVADSPQHYVPGPDLKDQEAFDLMRNPLTRVVVIAWFCGVALCFVEMFGLQSDDYLDVPPWRAFQLTGIVTALGLAALMRRVVVPWAESLILGVLGGGVAGVLAYFLALHVNRWTDPSPARETIYVVQENLGLRPRDGEWPELNFPADYDYWSAQAPGSEHGFVLRRGLFGFWQYDRDAYFGRIRDWHDAGKPGWKASPASR